MNKLTKLLSVFVIAGAIGTGIAGVAGCNNGSSSSGGGGNKHDHVYEYTQIAGNAEQHNKTCTADGHTGNKTIQEGHNWVGDKCKDCDYPKPVIATEVSVTITCKKNIKVDEIIDLTATVAGPVGTTQNVNWTIDFGDDVVEFADEAHTKLKGLKFGDFGLTATSVDDPTKSATFDDGHVTEVTIYDTLSESENLLVSDKTVANGNLTTDTTAGIYAKLDGGNVTVSEESGVKVFTQNPDSKNISTIINLGPIVNVEGYLETKISATANAGENFIVFNNGNTAVLIITATGTALSYKIGDGTAQEITGLTFATTKFVSVYYKIDTTTGKITLKVGIDSTTVTVLDNADSSIDGLSHITLATSNGGQRKQVTKNIVVTGELVSVADYQTEAKEKLATEYAKYNEDDYTAANWTALGEAKTAGETAIDAATDLAGVDTALANAITALKEVESKLDTIKNTACAALDTYVTTTLGGESNYPAANWTKLQTALTAGKTAINKAADETAVNEAKAAAEEALAAIPNSELQAELDARDDCSMTVLTPDTENAQTIDGTSNKGVTSNTEYKKEEGTKPDDVKSDLYYKYDTLGVFKLTYSGSSSKPNLNKGGYLSLKSSSILIVTTTSDYATIKFDYNGTSSSRTFSIVKVAADATINATSGLHEIEKTIVASTEPAAWKDADNKSINIKEFTLDVAGTYEIRFDNQEHKINSITLTENKSVSVQGKVNKLDATVSEDITVGDTIASVISDVAIQLDYNGELQNAPLTSADYTVIVKKDGAAVEGEAFDDEGEYTILIIYGSNKAETAATKYNSKSITVNVASMGEGGEGGEE